MSSEALQVHVDDLRELSEQNQEIAEVLIDMMMAAEDEIDDSMTIE